MKKAIVIGATGLIGKALVEQLANDPEVYGEVVSITRCPVNYASEKSPTPS